MRAKMTRNSTRAENQPRSTWRVLVAVITVMALVVTLIPATETLAWGKKKPEPKEERAPRLNKLPPMKFITGDLTRDSRGQWTLNGRPVHFTRDSILMSKSEYSRSRELRSHEQVQMMGHWLGRNFVVRTCVVLEDNYTSYIEEPNIKTWSPRDPASGLEVITH